MVIIKFSAKHIVPALISLAIIGMLLLFADIPEIIGNILSFGLLPFLFANLFFAFMYVIRGLKWKLILGPFARVSLSSATSILILGFFVNNFLPARVGEIVRALVLSRKMGLGKSISLASVVVDRITDTLGLLVLFFAAIAVVHSVPAELNAVALALLALMLLFLAAFMSRSKAQKIMRPFLFWVPGKGKKFLSSLATVTQSLRSTRGVQICFLSIVTWALYIPFSQYILSGLGVRLGIAEIMVVVAIVSLSAFIPALPGYIGTTEGATVIALGLFGIDVNTALSFAIITHLILYVTTTILGFISLQQLSLSLADVGKTLDEKTRNSLKE